MSDFIQDVIERRWVISTVILAIIGLIVAALSLAVFLIVVPDPVTYNYTSGYADEICSGDPLVVTMTASSAGKPNYTLLGQSIYNQNGSLALRLNRIDPVVGGDFGAGEVAFTVSVAEARYLLPGEYIYTRVGVQIPNEDVAWIDIPFTVKECD